MNSSNIIAPSSLGIIGAMPQEVITLTQKMSNLTTHNIANMCFYTGLINNQSIVVLQCGIGKVNAAIGTTLMTTHFKPQAIINTGSAGGIHSQLKIGDVIIGESVSHHDVDVTAFGYQLGQMAGMPANYSANSQLVQLAKESASQITQQFSNAHIHLGSIVSGDQFISDSASIDQIKSHFSDAFAVEMEAAAIAQTCYQFNIPFVVIRAISDLANKKASTSFDEFIETAGKHSAEMVIGIIQKFNKIS